METRITRKSSPALRKDAHQAPPRNLFLSKLKRANYSIPVARYGCESLAATVEDPELFFRIRIRIIIFSWF
jgi:hypothetical protein